MTTVIKTLPDGETCWVDTDSPRDVAVFVAAQVGEFWQAFRPPWTADEALRDRIEEALTIEYGRQLIASLLRGSSDA